MGPPKCPVCDAPPHRREHLGDAFELCNGCGFAIRLNQAGELIGWATTSKSHPKGIWAVTLHGREHVVATRRTSGT